MRPAAAAAAPGALSPGALDLLKVLAVATMALDHVDKLLLFRAEAWMFHLGRLAFPLFALLVAHNAVHVSRSGGRYLGRLALLALISQPAYAWALRADQLNVVATLALGLLGLLGARSRARAGLAVVALIGLDLLGATPTSYGGVGAALVVAAGAWFAGRGTAFLIAALGLTALLNVHLGDPRELSRVAAALCAWLPVALLLGRELPRRLPRWTRWGWYAFYPVHLALLAALRDHLLAG